MSIRRWTISRVPSIFSEPSPFKDRLDLPHESIVGPYHGPRQPVPRRDGVGFGIVPIRSSKRIYSLVIKMGPGKIVGVHNIRFSVRRKPSSVRVNVTQSWAVSPFDRRSLMPQPLRVSLTVCQDPEWRRWDVAYPNSLISVLILQLHCPPFSRILAMRRSRTVRILTESINVVLQNDDLCAA